MPASIKAKKPARLHKNTGNYGSKMARNAMQEGGKPSTNFTNVC